MPKGPSRPDGVVSAASGAGGEPQQYDHRPLGWLLAAVGMIGVSTDSLWVRLSEAEAIDVAFWVACCALPLYAVLGRWLDHASPIRSLRTHTKPLLALAVLSAASQVTFITAITQTRVANVVAIVAASPLMASAVARVALKERISARVGVAIAVTILGVGLIVSTSLGQPTLRGDVLALVAVACFSVSLNIWRRHPEMSRFTGLSLSAAMVVVATAFFASPFSLDMRAYLAVAAMGLCFNPLGRLAHSSAPRFAPVSEVSLFIPIETVAGTVWAAVFLGELPRPMVVVGGVVVMAGVFYGTIATLRRNTVIGASASPPI